ncbi:MAG TPA: hypothetical protein VF426_09170 [Marmoricola sp.]
MPVDTPASASRRVRAIVAAGVVGVLACGGFVIASLYVDLPDWSTRVAATLLAALYATALSVRLGGRPLLPAVLVIAYGAVATATGWQTLLGGAAVGMAVLAASLAIMATVPAPTVRRAVVETVIAAVVATFGGLGCRGFAAGLHQDRFASIVLGLTLLAAFVIVYRLGAGFHGLGRRGYVVAITAAVVLVLALAYTAAFDRWGNPTVIGHLDDLRDYVRDHLHAVPHPIEVLLGIPALCWGIFMRARRRQGWWVCAFGAALTAPSAGRFVVVGVSAKTAAISVGYTLVLGFIVAWLVIRVDQALTGNRGRRARRDEEADAHRPEPGRFEALR